MQSDSSPKSERIYRFVSLQNGNECWYGDREGTEATSGVIGEQGYKMYGPGEDQCYADENGYMYGGAWRNAVYEIV
jgi:hypothetical protein